MFVLDSFLGFVFRTIATVADQELNDETRLKERLVEAQLALEDGSIDEAEFARREAAVFDWLRALRAEAEAGGVIGGDARVVSTHIDASLGDDD